MSIHRSILIFLSLTSFQSIAQVRLSKASVVQLRNEFCLLKPIRNLQIIEINRSFNSLNHTENSDTFFTQYIINGGQMQLWLSKGEMDILVFGGNIYEFYHKSNKYKMHEFKGDCEDVTGRIANQYLNDVKDCPTFDKFELTKYKIWSDSMSYELFRQTGIVDSLYIRESLANGKLIYTEQEFVLNGVKFSHKASLISLKLGTLDSIEFTSKMLNYIKSHIEKYAKIEQISYDAMLIDSNIFKGDLPFLNLNNQKVSLLPSNKASLFVFSFVGCVPCALLKHELSKLTDTSNLKFQIYIVNSSDSNERIYKEMERYNQSFQYLRMGAFEEKSNFQVSGFPTIYIVDSYGNILYHKRSYNFEMIDDIIRIIQKEQS